VILNNTQRRHMQSILLCYPSYSTLAGSIRKLSLKQRSVLIKQCQAQYDVQEPVPMPIPTIIKLLDSCPDGILLDRHYQTSTPIRMRHFFSAHNQRVSCPLISAIVIDLLRAVPVQPQDAKDLIYTGWMKEIELCQNPRGMPECNFDQFFQETGRPVHPSLPENRLALFRIRNKFRDFKRTLENSTTLHYPRSTHKNMSWGTRRHFEEIFQADLSDVPIFGQDDWQRVYHDEGIKLQGPCEIRQTWTAGVAKPRIYAAQGGTAYEKSRHLQGFFSDLHDIFPPTHRLSRLRPGRLVIPPNTGSPYFLVYDLSSFTSNMIEQKGFCESLAAFMMGVPYTIVDEVEGPITVDLGELLVEYNDHCVVEPEVSLERCPMEGTTSRIWKHARASLLGIFGNLMTCTVAHYLIMCQNQDSFDEDNTAGDDGLALEYGHTEVYNDIAIRLVGSYAVEKTFRSFEEGAVCLKRPLAQHEGELVLGYNIVPPVLITAISKVLGEAVDSRYRYYPTDLTRNQRISVVGIDLMRFLRSCWMRQHEDFEEICAVYDGFTRMVNSLVGFDVRKTSSSRGSRIVWPLNPREYVFYDTDPILVYALFTPRSCSFQVREYRPVGAFDLHRCGDSYVGNVDKRLALLEKLGYLEKEDVLIDLDPYDVPYEFYTRLVTLPSAPDVYTFRVLRDIPEVFLY
jgi:hypothetical protein